MSCPAVSKEGFIAKYKQITALSGQSGGLVGGGVESEVCSGVSPN